MREFTHEEIGDALFQIGPLKAPAGLFFSVQLGDYEGGNYLSGQGVFPNG
jgi:hypothetical protein